MMALRAKHPKHAKPSKPKILIYGKPGVGKTWGALDFPSTYLVDSEGGANLPHYAEKLDKSGGVYMGPDDGANDMVVVLDQIKTLATTKHPYRTLVIDSFTKLFNTAIAVEYERMEREKTHKDMTKTFGAEKKPAVARSKQMISWFGRLDMNVILICHEKALWKESEQIGETFDGYDKLEYELDLVIQIVKQGASRKAKIGKNRLQQFREGEVMDWSYAEFTSRYGIDVIEAESTHVEPAAAEQITSLVSLADLVKLDDEIKLKWFDAAGVTSWGELDAATAQKCIDYLAAKLPKAAVAAVA